MTNNNNVINNEIVPNPETVSMEDMLNADIVSAKKSNEVDLAAANTEAAASIPNLDVPDFFADIPMPQDENTPVATTKKQFTAEETAAWKKERDGRIYACVRGGQKLYVCSFVSGKARKAVITAKSTTTKEELTSNVVDLRQYRGGQAASAVWAMGNSITWLYNQVKAGKFAVDKETLVVLGTNNNAAAIYVQKAIFNGGINFSQSCSLNQQDRNYIADAAMKIAKAIAGMKSDFGCDVAVEPLDRNTISSNGHAASDLYAFRESVATFGTKDVKGTQYQMFSVPVILPYGEERSFDFFTKFRPTFQGAKGVIRSYKAKDGKTPVEFYVESPYRSTIWNLYNGIKEKINN